MSLGYVLEIDVGGAGIRLDNWERAGQADPEQSGGVSRAYAGNEYSSVVAEFMKVPLVSGPVSTADYAQVDAIFARGAQVPCRGDAFKGRTDTITCSGKLTAEMVPGGIDDTGAPLWVMNLLLSEVDNAGTAIATDATIYLAVGDSPDDPGDSSILLASADAADDPFSAGTTLLELMNAPWTIPTCGNPLAPDPAISCAVGFSGLEKTWKMAPAVNPGWLTGRWRVVFLSTGDTGDRWSTQAFMVKIFIERASVDIAQWDTGWSDTNGGFAGGDSTATSAPIVFQAEAGDVPRFELYSRAGLHSGYADNSAHQTLRFGNGGGGSHYGRALIGGDVATIWPS